MRLRNAIFVLIVGLCIVSKAVAGSVALTIDEFGDLAITGAGSPVGGSYTASGAFDGLSMPPGMSTLQYTGPGLVENYNTSNSTTTYTPGLSTTLSSTLGANRQALILTEPGDPNQVSDLIIFNNTLSSSTNGSVTTTTSQIQITVYNRDALDASFTLAKDYGNVNGGGGLYDVSTPLGLAADLELQNPTLTDAFLDFMVIPEGGGNGVSYVASSDPTDKTEDTFGIPSWPGTSTPVTVTDSSVNFDGHLGTAYSYTPTSTTPAGDMSYTYISGGSSGHYTYTTDPVVTFTFVDAVPLPNTAATITLLLGFAGGIGLCRRAFGRRSLHLA